MSMRSMLVWDQNLYSTSLRSVPRICMTHFISSTDSTAERAGFEPARVLRLKGLANPRNGPGYATSPQIIF